MGATTGVRSPGPPVPSVTRASLTRPSVVRAVDTLRIELDDPAMTALAIAALTLLTFTAVRITGGERRFEGAVFSGPATRWYAVPALAPGTYRFVCDVHPSMTGRLVAS